MRVSREELLDALKAVLPGTSAKETLEQSDCVLFRNGRVRSFNDFVYCSAPSPLDKDTLGAFRLRKLLDILEKKTDGEVEVSQLDKRLRFRGKGWLTQALAHETVSSNFDLIERPDGWTLLHDDFCDGLSLVADCASSVESLVTSFVHVHPGWVEAFDNRQMMRYEMDTGVADSLLLKKNAVRSVSELGMLEVSDTPNWVHFRNKHRCVLGARKFLESYPDLTPCVKQGGVPVSLPEDLEEVVKTATLACSDTKDQQLLLVHITKGRIDVLGESLGLSHRESRAIKWKQKPVCFFTFPKILEGLCKKTTEVFLTKNSLIMDGGRWKHVTFLGQVENFSKYEELLKGD